MQSPDPLPQELQVVESERSVRFDNLRDAAKESVEVSDKLRMGLSKELSGVDVTALDIVITGSIARKEVTRGSDCDHLLVSSSTPGHDTIVAVLDAVDRIRIELDLGEPGQQGVFGDFVTASELFVRIGLERDSNLNMTRRLSILLESESFLAQNIRASTIRRIIERYCGAYAPSHRKEGDPVAVPRFLVNDVIRYWRTIAVDFEAKRWRNPKSGWGLRYAKLLTARKIMFAGSLIGYLLSGFYLNKTSLTDTDKRHQGLIDYLCAQSEKTPVARLAAAYPALSEESKVVLTNVLLLYDKIMGLLDSPGSKKKLKAGSSEDVMNELVGLADELQKGLEAVFFDDELLKPLTRRYSLY